MNTRNPDFITVDLRGLKAALVSRAQARRESLSMLVRRAVARELGQSESVPQLVGDTGCLGASQVPRVKLSIRLTTDEARRLAAPPNCRPAPGGDHTGAGRLFHLAGRRAS